MLEDDLLKEAKKNISQLKTMNGEGFPRDSNFLCPFCAYEDEHGRVSAKIFGNTRLFRCFACGERRRIV